MINLSENEKIVHSDSETIHTEEEVSVDEFIARQLHRHFQNLAPQILKAMMSHPVTAQTTMLMAATGLSMQLQELALEEWAQIVDLNAAQRNANRDASLKWLKDFWLRHAQDIQEVTLPPYEPHKALMFSIKLKPEEITGWALPPMPPHLEMILNPPPAMYQKPSPDALVVIKIAPGHDLCRADVEPFIEALMALNMPKGE